MSESVVQEGADSAATGWPAELNEEYEFLGELGRGGMAVVYRARERALGRDVAVKVVRPRFHSDEESVARLAREARTVAQLEHPNIVSLHAIKRLTNGLALVMQLVPGQTLKSALAGGPLAVDRAESVLRDIARALAYAHRNGVVHRDVKPENIFLDEITGRALLSDFGVARSISENTELTATGTAIGTPTYMSPEQIDGGALDGRSDLYALGMVGWEMLSGQRPWAGESLYSVIYRQKHDPLPGLEVLRPDVPQRLQYLIEGLMHKRPDQRWPSAARFLTLLTGSEKVPGFKEWQAGLKRRRRSGPRGRTVEVATVSPVSSTVQFRRGDTPQGTVPSSLNQQSLTPSGEVAIDAIPSPWIPHGLDGPAPDDTGRRRAVLAVGGVLVLVAFAALTIFRPQRTVESATTPGTAVLGDARGVEVPVLPPPAVDTGFVDSVAAAGVTATAQLDSTTGSEPASPVTRDTVSRPERPPIAVAPPPRVAVATPVTPTDTARDTTAAPVVEAPAPASVTFAADRGTVAAGSRHSCTLDANGRVLCWGNNESGQLGDGGFVSHATPEPVAGSFAFAFVSAGSNHTCATTRDGEVYCWGANGSGQLGDGTTTPRSAPVRVSGSASFRIVRTGALHTCGLTTTGRVQCWGGNARGQLGTTGSGQAPGTVPLGSPAGAVSVGQAHSCAITTAGTALCWGRNDNGQLGDGTITDRRAPVPVAIDRRFISIAAGGFHTCGVTTDNELYCWGQNRWGQLGLGNTLDAPTPERVESPSGFLTVTAGLGHTCARSTDGRGWCWGRNAYGQLGDGTAVDRPRPTLIRSLTSFTMLNATGSHTCGVSGGESYCWGWNVDGQLGVGDRENASTPSRVAGVTR
jgi:serine/threonine protein kinase/alpha-tubulin suppressor-like RCC1 family protein